MRPIPRLHVITDVELQRRRSQLELAAMAARGGADAVQLRDKNATDDALLGEARAMRELGPALIIDDRVDLAWQIGAHGVHLGPDDAPPAIARASLGPEALIGATVNDLAALQALAGAPIDYIGVGPAWPTGSKQRPRPVLGLDGLAQIAEASPWPVIAIGGITADRVADVLSAGAWGVAVIGAVVLADDPVRATAALREAIERGPR